MILFQDCVVTRFALKPLSEIFSSSRKSVFFSMLRVGMCVSEISSLESEEISPWHEWTRAWRL